jgi:arabinose-5-phosphate isomerase
MTINDSNMNAVDIARNVLQVEADAVLALIGRLDSNFGKAVDIILNAKGRVVVSGMGKSGLIAKKIAATLASTGTPAFFLHPAEASHGDLGMVTSQDVIIAISSSGETNEMTDLIPFLKRFDVSIISMTGNPHSTLSKAANAHLDVTVREEACPLGITPTASTTAALAMGDALAVALLVKRGFRQEDFASFHPGGSLGKKFFVRVGDLMHVGEDLPVVSDRMPVMDAIMEISSKRLGIAIVEGNAKKMAGVLTDGDVRRGIQKFAKEFFDMKTGEVMTKNPRTIDRDELAAKALSMMQAYSITSLVVPDSEGRALGIIHLHDILKKGIV